MTVSRTAVVGHDQHATVATFVGATLVAVTLFVVSLRPPDVVVY